MKTKLLFVLSTVLAVATLPACESDDDDDGDDSAGSSTGGTGVSRGGTSSAGGGRAGSGGSGGTSGKGSTGGQGGTAASLSDPQVLDVAITANAGEVSQAEIAIMRANAEEVRTFAEMMLEEHSAAAADAATLGEEEGITPATNPVSNNLRTKAMATVSLLEDASEEDFDRVYMESQVMAHQEVLAMLNAQLIPQADNAALTAFLTDMRNKVQAHEQEAEEILNQL
jgi:putative membrane protein